MARFAVTPFNSLLLTFGLTGIIEALIQSIWTADFRKLESATAEHEVQGRRAVRAGARADHAGPRGRARVRRSGPCCASPTSAARCAPRPRTRRSPPRSASTSAQLSLLLAGTCSALASVAGVCLALHVLARAVADLRVDRRRLRRRDARRPRQRAGAARRRPAARRQRGGDDGGDVAVVGAAGLVHAADRWCCCCGRARRHDARIAATTRSEGGAPPAGGSGRRPRRRA